MHLLGNDTSPLKTVIGRGPFSLGNSKVLELKSFFPDPNQMEVDFDYALRTHEKKTLCTRPRINCLYILRDGSLRNNVSARVKRAEIRRDPSRTRGITEIVRARSEIVIVRARCYKKNNVYNVIKPNVIENDVIQKQCHKKQCHTKPMS